MANPDHFARLQSGVEACNNWRDRNPRINVDLQDADLCEAHLSQANLTSVNLQWANMAGANLSRARLTKAKLNRANLNSADLKGADLSRASLTMAELRRAGLSEVNLGQANLSAAKIREADLSLSYLSWADLSLAELAGANLTQANLTKAYLHSATLTGAILVEADLREADLTNANLSRADLRKADLRSANLQGSRLDQCKATDIKFWETQRAGWNIRGLICERAFWDKEAKEQTAYGPSEFERLYSAQTCIEMFYQGGVSTFELNTLPALLHHLASLHPGANIRLKSVEETGGGAKISISVGDADAETTEKIRADAARVYRAQLALRDNEILRLDTEKKYLESFVSEKLIKAMLTAVTPQNVFNAPVTGVVIASGDSQVDFHQSVNDNSATIALLDQIMAHHADLALPRAEESRLHSEVESTKAELNKPSPDKSVVAKGLQIVRTIAGEALKGAAGKIGERAASGEWQTWLHQLGQLMHQLK